MASAPRSEIPKLTDLPLVIETPRVKLRPPSERDAEAVFPYVSDSEVSKYTSWSAHKNVEETREWLKGAIAMTAAGTDVVWTIEHEGAPVGSVGLHAIVWGVRAVRLDRTELGYWLARPLWGKGLMTEAATAATRWAFETLGLHKVNVMCCDGNVGSQRVIEKVGFRFLCRLEEHVWRDGKWNAHLRYELLASEWADSTRTLRFQRPAS